MKLIKTKGESLSIGGITRGCRLCIEGKKLVLFVTGVCNQRCWYCTISRGRWLKDQVWANEKLVKKDSDLIEEAKLSNAMGAGITGGEPTLKLKRVVHYIKLLKKNFGKKFQIHMYSCGKGVKPSDLKKLHEAGLDEIRFHLNREIVKEALKYDWKVGMEVPVILKSEKELCKLVDYLESVGADFLNLNELEFSDRNVKPMMNRGYKLRKDSMTAVGGSEETALKVLKYASKKRLRVHYCTAALKMNYQLRNRLKRRAKNIKRDFEKVTKDGFLLKGTIYGRNLKKLASDLKIPKKMYVIRRGRIETSVEMARMVAKKIKNKVAVVEEYPSAEPWDFEVTPLN